MLSLVENQKYFSTIIKKDDRTFGCNSFVPTFAFPKFRGRH